MRYAITPRGIGKPPGARAVEDHFPPAPGETFRVAEAAYHPDLVLAEDSVSLRAKTPEELDAEVAAVVAAGVERDGQAALAADARADAIFTALQTATPAQIATFVANRFSCFRRRPAGGDSATFAGRGTRFEAHRLIPSAR